MVITTTRSAKQLRKNHAKHQRKYQANNNEYISEKDKIALWAKHVQTMDQSFSVAYHEFE